MVAALSVVQSLPGGKPSATLLISGVKKSWTPVPDGPASTSYAGCLSDQAVRRPCCLATSKIVFTWRYWLGRIGLQVPALTGRAAGLMTVSGLLVICRMLPGNPLSPWPASSESGLRSAASKYITSPPGAGPEQFVVPAGKTAWFQVSS